MSESCLINLGISCECDTKQVSFQFNKMKHRKIDFFTNVSANDSNLQLIFQNCLIIFCLCLSHSYLVLLTNDSVSVNQINLSSAAKAMNHLG